MSKLKIGIMSFAHGHGIGYLAALSARDDVEVRVADIDEERGRRIAGQYGVEFVPSYDELLAWGPDGVAVTAENSKHRELTELAAAAGAYVLCEKPLATTAEDGWAMVEACERAGVGLMTAFPVRWCQPVQAFETLIRSGKLGKIHGVAGTNPGSMPGYATPWFIDKELAGGGAMMDHTVHVADLLRWMLGCEAVEVYAQTNRILYPDIEVETAGTVVVTFEDGTVATIDCSWSKPKSYPTWGTVTLEFVGDNGIATVDAFGQTMNSYYDGPDRSGGQDVQWMPWGSNADAGMIDEFLASIRERRQPSPSGLDGLRATEIALAGYESVESGQPVPVNLVGSNA